MGSRNNGYERSCGREIRERDSGKDRSAGPLAAGGDRLRCSVLLCAAAVWFLYLPKYEEITSLEERLQALEKKLATAKINAAELGKLQVKMQEAEAQFKIAMRALPEKEEIPSLLTNISKSGHEIGLEFLLFEPKAEVKKDFYAEIPS